VAARLARREHSTNQPGNRRGSGPRSKHKVLSSPSLSPIVPAANAGIRSGDIITSVQGKPLKDERELSKMVSEMVPGTQGRARHCQAGEKEDARSCTRTSFQVPRTKFRPVIKVLGARKEAPIPPGSGSRSRLLRRAPKPAAGGVIVHQRSILMELPPSAGFQAGDVILDVAGEFGKCAGRRAKGTRRRATAKASTMSWPA
jgi:membrane-associated protease RseP (regulator of RpoE activity)